MEGIGTVLVGVETETLKMLQAYGFKQLLADAELTTADVVQILVDHGYLNLEVYEDEE